MQHNGVRLLEQALRRFGEDVRSVANIGARIDGTSAYLAPRFPHLEFISVDFQPNLQEHNRLFPQAPNWKFMTGYALDLLRRGELRPDAVYMTSTSVLFNNKELDAYVEQFARVARLIVINEPWWPRMNTLNIFHVLRPEDIPPEKPYAGGVHSNYHHNYIVKFENAGFEINTSKILATADEYYALQIVARRRQAERK
jgi:hypothetical protein